MNIMSPPNAYNSEEKLLFIIFINITACSLRPAQFPGDRQLTKQQANVAKELMTMLKCD